MNRIHDSKLWDWLETQRWYWFSINLSFNVFPWHWEARWEKYEWGRIVHFGPFGIAVLWQ
jgi:hypothetical protein